MLEGGAQAEGPAGLIIALRANVGNVFETSPTDTVPRGYQRGSALSVTTELAPGPLTISLATRSWRQRPVIEIAFGARF